MSCKYSGSSWGTADLLVVVITWYLLWITGCDLNRGIPYTIDGQQHYFRLEQK